MTLVNNLLLLSLYKQFCKKVSGPKERQNLCIHHLYFSLFYSYCLVLKCFLVRCFAWVCISFTFTSATSAIFKIGWSEKNHTRFYNSLSPTFFNNWHVIVDIWTQVFHVPLMLFFFLYWRGTMVFVFGSLWALSSLVCNLICKCWILIVTTISMNK